MSPVLEGKEVEKSFDNGAGQMVVDVTEKGEVSISLTHKKESDLDGYAKVKSEINMSAETNVLDILEKLCAKTKTKWDDTLVAGLKNLLGLEKSAPSEEAK